MTLVIAALVRDYPFRISALAILPKYLNALIHPRPDKLGLLKVVDKTLVDRRVITVAFLSWSYHDRNQAGEILSRELLEINFKAVPQIFAIPNGGIAVAAPIARALNAGLDLLIVRKLQIPWNLEAGFGAVTSLGTVIFNKELVSQLGLSKSQIDAVIEKTKEQIATRKAAYSGLVGRMNPTDHDVILVDDGLASGYTMMAAVKSVSELAPMSVTVAVPTASARAVDLLQDAVDRLICPRVETGYIFAVANAYQNWYDVPDSEVIALLKAFK